LESLKKLNEDHDEEADELVEPALALASDPKFRPNVLFANLHTG